MKKLKKMSINSMELQMRPLNQFEQMELFGGGNGSMSDPFSESEAGSADFSNGAFIRDDAGNTSFRQDFSAGDWCGNYRSYVYSQNRAWYDWLAGEAISSIPFLGLYFDNIERNVNKANIYTQVALYDAICSGSLGQNGNFYVVNKVVGYSSTTETYNADTGELLTSISVDMRSGKLTNNKTGKTY